MVDDIAKSPTGGRVFLECTHTALHGGNSGIQRVVRNTINHGKGVGAELGLKCVPVVWSGRAFIRAGKLSLKPSLMFRVIDYFRGIYRAMKMLLVAVLPFLSRLKFPRAKLAVKTFLKNVRDLALLPLACILRKQIIFQKDDILLLLDSSWNQPLWGGVQKARAAGAKIGIVIYDLIPIRSPHVVTPELTALFNQWFSKAIEHADFFLSISNTVKHDCDEYLAARPHTVERPPQPVLAFQLGAELDTRKADGSVRQKLREIFAATNQPKPYIIVSTIEPRKNHAYLLDVFDRLWAQNVRVRLCIIGRVGFMCDELLARIKSHPALGRSLFIFNDINDTELSFCYEHARGMIFPSKHEGYGLPIIESLSKGLTVFASDIPIHREVGGEYCVYFDPDNAESLERLIARHERTDELPPHKSSTDFRWPDWNQSCRDLLTQMMTLAKGTRG